MQNDEHYFADRCLLNRTIYFDQNLHTYTFYEIGRENDKVKRKNILVTPGFKPLCVRLLDYNKASTRTIDHSATTYSIILEQLLMSPLPVLVRLKLNVP